MHKIIYSKVLCTRNNSTCAQFSVPSKDIRRYGKRDRERERERERERRDELWRVELPVCIFSLSLSLILCPEAFPIFSSVGALPRLHVRYAIYIRYILHNIARSPAGQLWSINIGSSSACT